MNTMQKICKYLKKTDDYNVEGCNYLKKPDDYNVEGCKYLQKQMNTM